MQITFESKSLTVEESTMLLGLAVAGLSKAAKQEGAQLEEIRKGLRELVDGISISLEGEA